MLERRRRIESPVPRRLPFIDKPTAKAKTQFLPVNAGRRQIMPEKAEAVGHKVDQPLTCSRDRVAPVHALSVAKPLARSRDFRPAIEPLGPHHRGEDAQLRQLDPEIGAEQARPGAAGQYHRAAGNSAPFGHHTHHAACRGLDAAHRATGKDGRAMTTRRAGNRWRPLWRLGLAMARRKERASEFLRDARQASRDFSAANDAAIQLILARMVEPVFEACEIRLRFSQTYDTATTEAGLG